MPPPMQPPMPYGMPPAPPAPRSRAKLGVIIAVVVVVLLLLVAVLYVVVFSQGRPTVTLGSAQGTSNGFLISVLSVSRPVAASSFQVSVFTNVSAGPTVPLSLYMNLTIGGDDYLAAWGDLNFDGRLTAGDAFAVLAYGSLPGGVTFTFRLLWNDGTVLASVDYRTTTSAPYVSFSSPSPITDGFEFSVTSVSSSVSAANFRANFDVNGTLSTSIALSPSMSFTVAGDTYSATWTDVGGDGQVNPGDYFTVTRSGGLPPLSYFTFYLLWSDNSTIATAFYYT